MQTPDVPPTDPPADAPGQVNALSLTDPVTVSGVILAADGTPERGGITFRPHSPAVDSTPTQKLISTAPVYAQLDASGAFTVDLTASDDDGWQLDAATIADGGMPYVVTVSVVGQPRCTYACYIPAPGPHDLWDLVQLDAPPNVVIAPGPEGPQGPQGVPGQDGAAATVDVGTVTPLAPDADPTVTNSGTTAAAVLDFGLPRSDVDTLRRVTHPNTDDVLVEIWDDGQARWQTAHYDSGWREVSSGFRDGWSGNLYLRRTNYTVQVAVSGLTCAFAGNDYRDMYDVPAGFRNGRANFRFTFYRANTSEWAQPYPFNPYQLTLVSGVTAGSAYQGGVTYHTNDPIPTSLPGTLVTPAPNQ